jgi:hypothetical protein
LAARRERGSATGRKRLHGPLFGYKNKCGPKSGGAPPSRLGDGAGQWVCKSGPDPPSYAPKTGCWPPAQSPSPSKEKQEAGEPPIARRRRRSAHGWSRKRSNQLSGATEDGAPCALGHVTDRQDPEDGGGGNRGSSHIYTHTWVYAREVYYRCAHVCAVSSAS